MKRTILVIEDDPMATRLVELTLSHQGYEVAIAANGLKGLQMAQTAPPDLILLDLMLPGQDGYEVLNRLRAEPRTAEVPVVVVSSKSQETDKQTAIKAGADAYLTKPFSRPELLETIDSLLQERSARETASSTCTVLLSPQARAEAVIAACTGLALARKGQTTTVVDLHPFSTTLSDVLGSPPPDHPAAVSTLDTPAELASRLVHHTSGLRLLHNLEGSKAGGQLTAADVSAVLEPLLGEEGIILACLPLNPPENLAQAVDCCDRILLVTKGDRASLAAARTALTLMERAGAASGKVGILLTDAAPATSLAGMEQRVIGSVPAEAGPGDPAFDSLADRLLP